MDGMGYIYIYKNLYHGFLYAKKTFVQKQFMAFCSTRDMFHWKDCGRKGLFNFGGLGLLLFCFRGKSLLFVSRLTDVFSHSGCFLIYNIFASMSFPENSNL